MNSINDHVLSFLKDANWYSEALLKRYRALCNSIAEENRSRFNKYAKQSMSWLLDEIRLCNPRAIILLGADVSSVIFNISQSKAKHLMNGQVQVLSLREEKQSVFCFPHPGIIMKRYKRNPWPVRLDQEIIPRARETLNQLGIVNNA